MLYMMMVTVWGLRDVIFNYAPSTVYLNAPSPKSHLSSGGKFWDLLNLSVVSELMCES